MLYRIQNALVDIPDTTFLQPVAYQFAPELRNTTHADAVQFQHVQTDFISVWGSDVEFSAH